MADLEAAEKIEARHVVAAIQYRSLERTYWQPSKEAATSPSPARRGLGMVEVGQTPAAGIHPRIQLGFHPADHFRLLPGKVACFGRVLAEVVELIGGSPVHADDLVTVSTQRLLPAVGIFFPWTAPEGGLKANRLPAMRPFSLENGKYIDSVERFGLVCDPKPGDSLNRGIEVAGTARGLDEARLLEAGGPLQQGGNANSPLVKRALPVPERSGRPKRVCP
jgi:hypothetical protein